MTEQAILLLGQINGKVDILLACNTDQETRLRSLERSRNYDRGVIATISAIAAFVSTYLFKGHA